MITGFNTDVEYDGVVYHVQTEDKGLDSPLILSLVYSGGAILASKRSPYEDLIAEGFDEAALAQRLKRQHRLICAAINAGRIEDLKRMGERIERESVAASVIVEEPEADAVTQTSPTVEDQQPAADVVSDVTDEVETKVSAPPVGMPATSPPSAYTVHDARRYSPLGERATTAADLRVSLLGDEEFRSGQSATITVLVQRRSDDNDEAVVHAAVSIKVLGTAFRPQMYSVTTDRDGVASVSAQIPTFTSGRAAVIIRVDVAGASHETRRVIQPGK